ncbi:MAG: hypothetical protein H6648_01350 [Caldilineae bacterium]|nr:hypothetical protein [Caldilineae bacterium]
MNLKFSTRNWPLVAATAALTGLAFGLVGGAQTSQAAPAQQGLTCAWEQVGNASSELFHSASAMDSDSHVMYIYGGVNGSFEAQSTVEKADLSGTNLSARHSRVAAGGAQDRIAAAGAYRAKGAGADDSAAYFIGGVGDPAKGQAVGDVQRYNTKTGSWEKLQLSVADRFFATATYVPEQDAIWVIGGISQCSLTDVLTGSTCQARSISTQYISFDAMSGAPMVNTLSGGNVSNYGHTAVYDSANKRILLYGGTNDISRGNKNLQALDVSDPDPSKAKFTNVSTSGSGPTVFFHSAAYDTVNNWMIVYGGASQGFLGRNESTETKTYALDLTQATPAWVDLKTTLQDRVAGAMEWDGMHNAAIYTLGRKKFNGDASRPQTVVRTTNALVCGAAPTPVPTSEQPTAVPTTPGGGGTTTPPTAVPTAAVGQVCDLAKSKVPVGVLNDALANNAGVSGWGLACNPNLAVGPLNPLRTWLSLRNPGLPYHPLFNGVVWKCGCP